MSADGDLRDAEALGDLACRLSGVEELEHLPLARGQLDSARIRDREVSTPPTFAELLHDATDELTRKRGFTAKHSAQHVRQPRAVHVPEHEAGSADAKRIEKLLVGDVVRDQHDRSLGGVAANPARDLE